MSPPLLESLLERLPTDECLPWRRLLNESIGFEAMVRLESIMRGYYIRNADKIKAYVKQWKSARKQAN